MSWTQQGNIRGPQGPAGPTGPQGDVGPVGPAGLNWRGGWAPNESYAVDDVVGWGGSSYFATAARSQGDAPPTGTAGNPGDDAVLNAGWALLAVQGATGPAGPAGPEGPAGAAGATGPVGPAGSEGPAGPAGPEGPEGPQGPQGSQGPAGPSGSTGQRGSLWFEGTGAPGVIAGAQAGDKYLDSSTGDYYTFS